MKYNLDTKNYKTFEIFADNILVPRSYFITFDSLNQLKDTDIRNERYSSSMVECLSGEWDFAYYEHCSDIHKEFDSDNVQFDTVTVPSTWQHTGYEKPYYLNTRYQFKPNPPEFPTDCPVGVYRKFIEIDDTSLNYTITFLGVAGSFDLFVNGEYVGYSEGSHNTSEFELNKFLRQGSNELLVVNYKWCNSTYLECQDMFRDNGIFRDVLLRKNGDNSIYDFEIKTDYVSNSDYSLKIKPALKLVDDCELTAFLYDDGELVGSTSVNETPNELTEIDMGTLTVNEWSAEIPYLYDLVLVLSQGENILEVVRKNIGFKHIEIEGNIFLFNNKHIKLMGVNHHDTNPKTGYVMSVEDMEKDVKIFKQFNVNCVRTSHYPPDPTFLDLCDEYGIYVVDEADIESHGCQTEYHRPGACSHNPQWKEHYWDRVYRMFERDKNHPSITMWSLGNESWGYANQDYCYENLKKYSSIPVHYENVVRTKRFAYDVISEMYPWHKKYDKLSKGKGLAKKWFEKPYFLCEYAHAMGVGAGELESYVSRFIEADNLMGGCIWEFADHAIYHEEGKYKYTYGGDHGEEKHDSNFCVDGLFFPDRTPHSGAYQMKNCYRPVRIKSSGNGKFTFFNYNYFANACYTVRWKSLDNKTGEVVKSDEISIDIPPRGEYSVTLTDISENVVFEYYNDDFLVASEQLEAAEIEKYEHNSDHAPSVDVSEKKLFVNTDNGQLIFNTKTGAIESYIVNGKELINSASQGSIAGFGFTLYRAPIDNDRNIAIAWSRYDFPSERVFVKTKKKGNRAYSIEDNKLIIENKYIISSAKMKRIAEAKIRYAISGDGAIDVDVKCTDSVIIPFAPRFGITLEMPENYDNVKYFGRGDMVNVEDYKEHAMLGVYECSVDDMSEKYIKPQESSMRSGVRFAEITDENGFGLRFVPREKAVYFGADHFTSHQCAKAMHQEDLKPCPTTVIHIDSYMLGAASGACGPVPSKQYRRNILIDEELKLTVIPICKDEE